ncbi:MAG: TonB family protein [candidate division KSB1 bacterium]|nr:TonB family protein [candidate division KSB1 bacterium]MDZ7318553.1 TonB family protein [candidate division KSB1 bacterium]MDZ7342237.1 TonB family protein [candidate division KSB1 bacterium]
MKNYIEEIDTSVTFIEDDAMSKPEVRVPYKIEKFPTEFKKKVLRSIDKTFLLILLSSILLNLAALYVLKKMLPTAFDASAINKIQEHYARLLLKGGSATTTYSFDASNIYQNRIDSKVITGLGKWMDVYTNNILESIKNIPALGEAGTVSEGTGGGGMAAAQLPSREFLAETRKTTAGSGRGVPQAELDRQVNSVGLLGLISREARTVDREYVDDLLEYASENSSHLEKVLEKLSTIEVPRYGSSGYLRKVRQSADGGGEAGEQTDLRGGRVTTETETRQMIENIAPIAEAKSEDINRNVQFEAVPSSEQQRLAELFTVRRTRTAQDVLNVVQSHTRAIQDCYKQELKYDPTAKGKVVVRFTINPEGIVTSAAIVSSTVNSPRMESCIISRVKGWRNFPPSDPAEGEKTYRQTFTFGDKK